ncbi:homeobox protein ceh-21-like [Montipora foliosa]|uniref:homeobox protein ceh-21-like n=1 Tax=Montipora foliosa TaxID=591990 RepID=UPI0035F180D4
MNSVTFKVTVDKEDRSALMTFVQEKGGSIEECAVQAARPQEAESLLISEDKNAEKDEREPVQTPKAIADGVIAWLKKNSVSQALFAEKILSRKQSTLSDVLRQPLAELPKGQGKWIYEKMENFLNDKQEQQQLIALKQGKRKAAVSSDEEEVNAAKKKRVHFTEFQLSGLNHAYERTKGRPTAQLMEKLAENFDLEQHQVKTWFQNQRNKRKNKE